MRKESKVDLVKDLTNKFKENNIFYLLDASGLTVAQVNAFREKCFKRDVEYKVVKNMNVHTHPKIDRTSSKIEV